jgi:NAD(P)-dependent dehydrogenase (short-subunit alcohol dehydrogenase family)
VSTPEPPPPPAETAALITGGAGGLGSAVARALDAQGYRVVLLVRSTARGREVAEGLRGEAAVYACDVTERDAVDAAVRQAAEEIAPPLVLVNAAGIAESRPLLPPDDDLWAKTLAVNVTGPWHAATACLPYMEEAGWGFVCNVASTAGLEGYRYTAAYTTSKHALVGLTRAMAEDLRGSGVRVTAVCPGFLDTPMTARTVANMVRKTGMSEEEARAALAGMNRSERLIDPEEVAAAILDLLQGEGGHGAAVRID